jgi:hypothetical protein
MNKYLIKVAEFHYRPVEVIASNEEDAKRLALEMLTDNKIKNQSVYSHTLNEEDWETVHLETIKTETPMNNTKIVVIEFNIRPKKEDCNLSFKPKVPLKKFDWVGLLVRISLWSEVAKYLVKWVWVLPKL